MTSKIYSTTHAVLLICLVISFCTSCQPSCDPSSWLNAPPPSRERNYLVWSDHPAAFLAGGADAYYCRKGSCYWAVLTRTTRLLPIYISVTETVILYLTETKDCPEPCQLKAGLALETSDDLPEPLSTLRLLKTEPYLGTARRRFIMLAYNGQVYGKSNREKQSEKTQLHESNRDWLRFDVGARKNRKKVLSIVNELYPLLEQEPDASDLLTCLQPLLSQKADPL